MDIKQFNIHMTGREFAMVTDDIFLFKKKHGKWEVYDRVTDSETVFDTLKEAFAYEVRGNSIATYVGKLDTLAINICGGRGASGTDREYSIGGDGMTGAGEDRTAPDYPARMNTRIKTKTEHEAIQEFRRAVNSTNRNIEHGIEIDKNGTMVIVSLKR